MSHPARPDRPERPATQTEPQTDPVRFDLIAELIDRLDQLDELLERLENAERQAADASEYLMHTRQWQEETVRTIQEERARNRQHQHALEALADHVRAALDALVTAHRTLPPEVHGLAVELHVLESSGFIARRSTRRPPG